MLITYSVKIESFAETSALYMIFFLLEVSK